MRISRKDQLAVALSLVLICAGAAVARNIVYEAYGPRATTDSPASIRGGTLDGGDAVDVSSPIQTSGGTISIFATHNNPTVAVECKFSVASSAATVTCVGFQKTGASTYSEGIILGSQTATAGLYTDGTLYKAPVLFFDSGGFSHYEFRVSDPTNSSNVTMQAWTFGAQTRGAGN